MSINTKIKCILIENLCFLTLKMRGIFKYFTYDHISITILDGYLPVDFVPLC